MPKINRPAKTKGILIRLTPEEHAAVLAFAEQDERSASMLGRAALFAYMNRK